MKMTASTLKPNDLVIAISCTGRTREVVEVVQLAKHYRAKLLRITAPDTDLPPPPTWRLRSTSRNSPDPLKPTPLRAMPSSPLSTSFRARSAPGSIPMRARRCAGSSAPC